MRVFPFEIYTLFRYINLMKGKILIETPSNKLVDLSVAFAIEILNLVKYLKSQHETIICNQIGRAGTCIGAKKMKPSGFASYTAGVLHSTTCRFIRRSRAS